MKGGKGGWAGVDSNCFVHWLHQCRQTISHIGFKQCRQSALFTGLDHPNSERQNLLGQAEVCREARGRAVFSHRRPTEASLRV
jgi:hypothetical protein